jgi:hypothetical protein
MGRGLEVVKRSGRDEPVVGCNTHVPSNARNLSV